MLTERVSEVFSIAAAVIASLGGGGCIVVLMSGWLGRVWASRIMKREKAELAKSIEEKKTELTRSIERDKAELAKFHEEHKSELVELSSQRQDALNRKRDVYTQLATTMRVLLKGNASDHANIDPRHFPEAYDKAYIWASESVVIAVGDLMDTLVGKFAADATLKLTPPNAPGFEEARTAARQLDDHARTLYQFCMLQMRRDARFSDSITEYRVISFE